MQSFFYVNSMRFTVARFCNIHDLGINLSCIHVFVCKHSTDGLDVSAAANQHNHVYAHQAIKSDFPHDPGIL